MAHCPNCGGEVRFSIESQDLECQSCKTHYDPKDYNQTPEGMETDVYKTQVFTCPNCGAEIESTDLSATGLCAYCGSAVVFESRVKEEKKPHKIIPFQITKEQCKKIYLNKIRSFYYRKNDLEDSAYLERFVGFYLPYWLYNFTFHEKLQLEGRKQYQSGNYSIKEDYALCGFLQGDGDGIPFDASLRFADNISGVIAPFSKEKMQEFSPNYLLGFYSEISDTEEQSYVGEAFAFLGEEVGRELMGANGFHSPDILLKKPFYPDAIEKTVSVDRAMFPIWFLSYKKGDRIAYAVVNGETGKIYCDIPIEERKFYQASFLLAIPIFIILNLFFQISAVHLPIFTLLLSLLLICLSGLELHRIRERDKEALRYSKKAKEEKGVRKSGTFLAILATVLSVFVLLWHPVRDEYYYLVSVLSAVAAIGSLRSMLETFNVLCTRAVPDFFEKKEE